MCSLEFPAHMAAAGQLDWVPWCVLQRWILCGPCWVVWLYFTGQLVFLFTKRILSHRLSQTSRTHYVFTSLSDHGSYPIEKMECVRMEYTPSQSLWHSSPLLLLPQKRVSPRGQSLCVLDPSPFAFFIIGSALSVVWESLGILRPFQTVHGAKKYFHNTKTLLASSLLFSHKYMGFSRSYMMCAIATNWTQKKRSSGLVLSQMLKRSAEIENCPSFHFFGKYSFSLENGNM